MDHRTKMVDRRRYEKRGVAVKASAEGRPLSESQRLAFISKP